MITHLIIRGCAQTYAVLVHAIRVASASLHHARSPVACESFGVHAETGASYAQSRPMLTNTFILSCAPTQFPSGAFTVETFVKVAYGSGNRFMFSYNQAGNDNCEWLSVDSRSSPFPFHIHLPPLVTFHHHFHHLPLPICPALSHCFRVHLHHRCSNHYIFCYSHHKLSNSHK
jgi:hypothetical protein